MPKNIAVFLDGTWNDAVSGENEFTNIDHLANSLSTDNQLIVYNSGVGSNRSGITRLIHAVIGKGVFQAARNAWRQVHLNYREGDKIFIFGFSRGAYAARHLAGMIVRYGLKGYQGDIETDFRKYLVETKTPNSVVRTPVHFLGLFDCVPGNQLYLLRDRSPHLNTPRLENGIEHFRHAVAIHERRYSFKPLLFKQGGQQSFEQRWFPGYHSDVGGNTSNSIGLGSFSLWWMIREAYGYGLDFNNITCPLHRAGNALGVVMNVDPSESPVCSDYWTTRRGIIWDRLARANKSLMLDTPLFHELDKCPRCGNDMFDYFKTDVAQRWIQSKLKVRQP